ncbi:MAG: transcription-repair coupling factor [Rhodospirillales bacterium]|nr:transcription-repair coupling factor [Alphaproteobacteria bacterium]MCB9986204.1 transcription-repair coupling factor [Rhodospirillales bacterium]USO07239.1 MAG: transcription-repair coupling factor [Rhodospirillales bacterium]
MKTLYGTPEGQDAFALRERAIEAQRKGALAVHVALDDSRIAALTDLLAYFAPDIDVLAFPAWDCLPYDRVSPGADIVGRRVRTLAKLSARKNSDIRRACVVLTSVNAVVQRVIPEAALAAQAITVRAGEKLSQDGLIAMLAAQGFVRTDVVREGGEFAVRGGIVDVFAPGAENPMRIDFFGDEVESLKFFDAATQRSLAVADALELGTVAEVLLTPESIDRFRGAYRAAFGVGAADPLYEAVGEGRRYAGMEHWLPLFYDRLETLFDYTPGAWLSFDHQVPEARAERMAQVADLYQARQSLLRTVKDSGTHYHPVPVETLFLSDAEWAARIPENAVAFSPFPAPDGESGARRGRDFVDIRSQPGANLFAAVADHIAQLQRERKKVLIACYSEGSKERIATLLAQAGARAELIVLPLEHGFANDRLALISEQDILGDRLARAGRGRRKADAFLREVSSLSPGDLVVHVDHGIGRFEGLETVRALGTLHDCLKLVYDGGDRLFLPVENIEMLSRFGADEGVVQLDRLGGAGWQARKARVKRDLLAMAGKLLEIAAARATRKAAPFNAAETPYEEFAARFPYHETEDQERAIAETLKDLTLGRPMDRLVCGDVGFGKTEIALRAAFVAALGGAQVAVVVPTTLLARQHTENFTRRFAGFPVRIAQLSRFVSAAEAKRTKDGLADGTIGIVIGTHALLASSVRFHNLGLVIVDEEQHFGVKQKEKLKDLRRDVHVLTLSATPIPRTLQMALSGVRDLSLIATPPVDRLAVRTSVMPYDPLIVREAILREHYRGGQTFFVVPRIKDIEEMEEQLRALVPEVKIVTAHGQMPPGELEARMTAFYEREYEVLMATNIIESGLDVPTANTLIVHHADLFGLAQLHQIRGRVGRSKLRAFAYLTWDAKKPLPPTAIKRLEVIGMLDSLGSGFQLASHDLDIRGSGNLLGEQQSGHIREVGVELYQQMLEEAVAAARAGVSLDDGPPIDLGWSPAINLGISVLIPESYVHDLNVRMSLYRRLATLAETDEVEAFAAELIDRFGPLPPEAENLLQLTTIKALCRKAGIESLEAGPKGVVVGFRKSVPPNPDGVIALIAQKAGTMRLQPDQRLFYTRAYNAPAQRLTGARAIAEELAALAA